jgi:hypothetical protein
VNELFRHARFSLIAIGNVSRHALRLARRPSLTTASCQQPLVWESEIKFSNPDQLRDQLRSAGIQFEEREHSFYIRPSPLLAGTLGRFVGSYPENSGWKIMKSFLPPSESDRKTLKAGRLLEALGTGPRIYDCIQLCSNGASTTCFVVEHVDGTALQPQESAAFVHEVGSLVFDQRDANSVGEGRLTADDVIKRRSDGRLFYVGVPPEVASAGEALLQRDLETYHNGFHFGSTPFHRGSRRYLYQSVPGIENGKRDTSLRWQLFVRALDEIGIRLQGRVVLDVCCNSGMILASALSERAMWGVGWDLPNVARSAQRLQSLLGNTRLDIVPALLSEDYRLSADVPCHLYPAIDGAVVFFLAAWRYVGFMQDLANIPWKALFYEGHEEDTPEEWAQNCAVMQRKWNCKQAFSTRMSDGDCGARDIALFIRP